MMQRRAVLHVQPFEICAATILLELTSFVGEVQYDDNFKFNAKCQDAIKKICEDLKVTNTSDKYLNMIQRNKEAQGSIKCFAHADLPNYLEKHQLWCSAQERAGGQ